MTTIQPEPNIRNRVIATIIDYGIYLAIWVTYIYTFGSPNNEGGYTVSGLKALPLFASWFLYFPFIESFSGQTLGHFITGTRVIDKSGKPISFFQSLKRRIFDPIDLFTFFGLVAIITIKNSDKHQRVGDLAAGTIVVGGESTICPHCGEKLILSSEEKIQGHYVCSVCKKETEM